MTTVALLSTSDTDLLTAAAAGERTDVEYRGANPSRILTDDIDDLARVLTKVRDHMRTIPPRSAKPRRASKRRGE